MTHTIVTLYTTIASQKEAEALAEQAIALGVAKCVNITPEIQSIYSWENTLEKTVECSMLFKTSKRNIGALKAFLHQHHPYTVPAMLEIVAQTSPEYFAYIEGE